MSSIEADIEKNKSEGQVEYASSSEDHPETTEISEEHKQYLIAKHGTYELAPLPSMDDNDPLNWSNGFKWLQLGMVAFHAFMATFIASGLVPVVGLYSEVFGMPTADITYLVSVQIILVGVCPLFWTPLIVRYGQRLLLIISAFGTMCFSLGSVFSNNYGSMMAMRCLQAIMISPSLAAGGLVVNDTTFAHQRGSRSGVWAIAINLGTMAGALFMGFVAEHQDVKYIHVVFTCINAAQVLAYFFFGKETAWNYQDTSRNVTNGMKQLRFKAIFPERTITLKGIFYPLTFFANWRVFVATFAYTTLFVYDNIALNVEIPEVMYAKFQLGPQALGLQFVSFIIGAVIGEVGGFLSDKIVAWGQKKGRGPSFRLWVTYPGFAASVAGLVVFGVEIDRANTWNIKPLIGCALASFGLQIVTSPFIAYCIDMDHSQAGAIILFITVFRQTLSFVGPFYFPIMFQNLGFTVAYAVFAGLIVGLGLIPALFLHIKEAKNGR